MTKNTVTPCTPVVNGRCHQACGPWGPALMNATCEPRTASAAIARRLSSSGNRGLPGGGASAGSTVGPGSPAGALPGVAGAPDLVASVRIAADYKPPSSL